MKLIEVKYIGDTYLHHFKMDDGSFKDVEVTKEEYEGLNVINPVNPTIEGGVWIGSSGGVPIFDTPTGIKMGRLNDGEWADIRGEFKMIKTPEKNIQSVSNDKVLIDGTYNG